MTPLNGWDQSEYVVEMISPFRVGVVRMMTPPNRWDQNDTPLSSGCSQIDSSIYRNIPICQVCNVDTSETIDMSMLSCWPAGSWTYSHPGTRVAKFRGFFVRKSRHVKDTARVFSYVKGTARVFFVTSHGYTCWVFLGRGRFPDAIASLNYRFLGENRGSRVE
jgi:hypothetical protein